MNRTVVSTLLLLVAACSAPDDVSRTFDESGGVTVVTVLDADWVRVGDRRVPLDRFILDQRLALRDLPSAEIGKRVVHILVDPSAPDVGDTVDRLIQQLGLAGIRQIRYL